MVGEEAVYILCDSQVGFALYSLYAGIAVAYSAPLLWLGVLRAMSNIVIAYSVSWEHDHQFLSWVGFIPV